MENLEYQEFLAYLFLYGASADLVIKQKEEDLILERVGKESYEKAKSVFEDKSDYERLQVILSHKEKFYPDDEAKEKILDQLKELFMADKDFSVMEQNIFRILKRIL